MKRFLIYIIICVSAAVNGLANKVVFYNGHEHVTYTTQQKLSPVVKVALDMFENDMQLVTGRKASHKAGARIEIFQLDLLNNKEFKKIQKRRLPYEKIITHKEAFWIGVRDGKIIIMGSDARGTAYGVLELSRMAGVSPWEWWGDVHPQMAKTLAIDERFETIQWPTVEYRGIEVLDVQTLGGQRNKKLYELLLRLRANTLLGVSGIEKEWQGTKTNNVITDDGYGYLLTGEGSYQELTGGNGSVFYHLSNDDYRWLSATSPGLVCHEMKRAYAMGARCMWIAKIHDPKVAAYQLSLFLDMAWNINSADNAHVTKHLHGWLQQQFGQDAADRLLPVMSEYFRLTSIRKPEHMVFDHQQFDALAFGNELERYIEDYARLRDAVLEIEPTIRTNLKDAFFAAVKYPVFAASAMACKQLCAQEARSLARSQSFHIDDEALVSAATSIVAYREVLSLTDYYNNTLAGGKWKGLMNMAQHDLPVFGEPVLPDTLSEQEIADFAHAEEINCTLDMEGCIAHNACDFTSATEGVRFIELLGHSMKAVALPKDAELVYKFDVKKRMDALLYVAAIPTHSIDGGNVSFSVQLDNFTPMTFNIDETGNTDRWKENILRQQVVNTMQIFLSWGTHTLRIKALTDNVIIDQWMIDHEPDRKFYMFPLQGAL